MARRKSKVCPVCKKVFRRPYNVTIHLKTHTNFVEKLKCPICEELVSTISNLRKHLVREGKKKQENISFTQRES